MRVVLWIFAIIGVAATLVTILLVIGLVALSSRIRTTASLGGKASEHLSDSMILTLDLDKPISEAAPQGFDFAFDGGRTPFVSLLGALERASADPRVKGLVARTGGATLGLAEAEEFRDVVKTFRSKGKFAFAFADSFGDLSGGTRPYYLASGFDEIWLQPAGSLALTGIASQIPFFKGTLDRLGVTAEFERRGEFKSAATQFTDAKLPDTDRAAMDGLVHSIYDQIVQGIGDGRKLAEADVKSAIDGGPYSGDEALAKHLVDHLGFLDEAEDAAKQRAGGGELVRAQYYLSQTAHDTPDPDDSVAIIRAVGEITGGSSNENPFEETSSVGADTLVRAFAEAVDDKSVKAILFRIESPGGSEVASETIWRAVRRAQQAGKPVIVSMSDVAASGGYYIAASADKIVAEPLTITGSIGVFAGKFVTAGLWDKIGVSWDTVSIGKNAEFGGSLAPFTPEQHQRFASLIDAAYNEFLGKVADGRHMPAASVDQIARGRVWTGVQAKANGLVDELGGLATAIKLAKQAAHLPTDRKVALKSFPSPKNPLAALLDGFTDTDGPGQVLATLDHLRAIEPLLRELEQEMAPAGGMRARMRPVELAD
jgi:protease-4